MRIEKWMTRLHAVDIASMAGTLWWALNDAKSAATKDAVWKIATGFVFAADGGDKAWAVKFLKAVGFTDAIWKPERNLMSRTSIEALRK